MHPQDHIHSLSSSFITSSRPRSRYRDSLSMESSLLSLTLTSPTVLSWVLCFMAASISSAGGVGGGSLFLPILNLVAGMNLKTSTAFSAFMVTGGSISNVLYTLFFRAPEPGSKLLIDFEIALMSESCMLLGVSVGVVCNVMFPDWLVKMLFALFLACSTVSTCRAGCYCWKSESDGMCRLEGGVVGEREREREREIMEEPLLGGGKNSGVRIPWMKVAVLVMVWLSFFVIHVLIGDKDGKSMMHIKPCGIGYWIITLSQVPLAFGFTAYILCEYQREHQQLNSQQNCKDNVARTRIKDPPMVIFPFAALVSGILGGLFGIGGGLLINPVLLHIGVPPQITAATTSFMVLFSSSMSAVQYTILGMKGIKEALAFAAVCFVASIGGVVIIQRVILKSGRASLIVFSVSIVMALSMVSVTIFGSIDAWRDYSAGRSMGFKLPCLGSN